MRMDGTSAKSVAHLVPAREEEDGSKQRRKRWIKALPQGGERERERRCLQLTGHVLVAGASQHGVHGVPHLVEEVLHHAGAEQGGGALAGLGQAQHQHHNRKLVLTGFLAPAAPADGEVTVLGGGGGADGDEGAEAKAQMMRSGAHTWWGLSGRWKKSQ